jgi:hypothetical protein
VSHVWRAWPKSYSWPQNAHSAWCMNYF